MPSGRRSLRAVLLFGAGLFGVAAMASMAFFVGLSASIRADVDESTNQLIAEQRAADQIVSAAYAQQLSAYRYLRSPGSDALDEFRRQGEEAYAGIRHYLFRQMPLSSRIKVEAIKEAHQHFEVAAQRAFDLALGGDAAQAQARFASLVEDAAVLERTVREFIEERVRERELLRHRQDAALKRLQWVSFLLALALAIAALMLTNVFRRRVMTPLSDLADAVRRVEQSEGRERVRVAPQRYEEFQRVADSLEQMAIRIQSSLSLLSATLEATTEAVLVVDNADQVVLNNRRFADMWRLPADTLAGQDLKHTLAHMAQDVVDGPAFVTAMQGPHADRAADRFFVIKLTDGCVVECYSTPQRVEDKTVGRVWSFRDITGRLELEAQLRQSQKMDAIGSLAGGVAHDFNNILTVIRGNVELMLADTRLVAEHRADLAEVYGAAERAMELTRQLLAFSRKQVVHPVALDIAEVVRELEPMLRRLIGEDITIETSLAPLTTVQADRAQIEQVLLNLVVNARDAMPSGGTVRIRAGHVQFEDDQRLRGATVAAGTYVALEVQDSGEGIPPENLDRVFEPFFTTKQAGKGTGLGLATVYGIVKQSSGFVDVQSHIEGGTTFRVLLPAAEHCSPVSRTSEHPAFSAGSGTVLVVEDEFAVRRFVQRALQRRGYEVLEAESGQRAIEIMRNHPVPIDVIVTDVVMPGMSGTQLIQELRAMGVRAPVLYMSGYADDEMIRRGVKQAEMRLLAKPFTAPQLAAALQKALRHPAERQLTGEAGPPGGA